MATNFATASYTEVIDLQTVNGRTSIIGLHTPVGARPYARLKGFFDQFRKFKYNGITSLVMVPAAQLPVDPLGLTGVQGTTDLMDPRDQLNPILFHGCHGENLTNILNTIYGASSYVNQKDGIPQNVDPLRAEISDSAELSSIGNTASDMLSYYRCLTDTSWKKFGIQNGVKLKNLHPLVWKVAQNHPLVPVLSDGGDSPNIGQIVGTGASLDTPSEIANSSLPDGLTLKMTEYGLTQNVREFGINQANGEPYAVARAVYNQQFTNGVAGLGWLPTTQISATGFASRQVCLPRLYMGVIVMPPAYNVEQYFRMVIRHSFSFRDFTSSLGAMGVGSDSNELGTLAGYSTYFNWIDYSEESESRSGSVQFHHGETIDIIGGESAVVSDGVS